MPYKDKEKERARCRAYYARNKDAIRARHRSYAKAKPSPEERHAYYERNKETLLARQRPYFSRYYEANREKRLEASRKWRAENKERMRAYRAERFQAEPEFRERYNEYSARRRARKKSAPRVEKIDRLFIYERDDKTCQLCGEPVALEDLELDHIVPLFKGGEHTHENLRATHMVCNRSRPRGPYR